MFSSHLNAREFDSNRASDQSLLAETIGTERELSAGKPALVPAQDRAVAKVRQLHVAQVSNLLYRSASSLQTLIGSRHANVLPIGNRRYSRLETCATTLSIALRGPPEMNL